MGQTRGLGPGLGFRARRAMRGRVLRWRTRWGRKTALRHLDLLAVALGPLGWRCVKLYHSEGFSAPVPVLRVYADATEDIGMMISVLATPGGDWGYHDAPRGRRGFLYPCGDAKAAARQVDRFLKDRMISP